MNIKESFDLVLGLLAQDTERLEREMQFVQLVADGDKRAYEIIAGICNEQIKTEAVPNVLDEYLASNAEFS